MARVLLAVTLVIVGLIVLTTGVPDAEGQRQLALWRDQVSRGPLYHRGPGGALNRYLAGDLRR